MDAKSFMGSVQLFSSRHTTLLWVIFGIVVLIGIFQVEKMGESIGKFIYYVKHWLYIHFYLAAMVVLVFIFI